MRRSEDGAAMAGRGVVLGPLVWLPFVIFITPSHRRRNNSIFFKIKEETTDNDIL